MRACGNMESLIELSDFELVQHGYELVRQVDDVALADELYIALGEAFERWAPAAERADLEARHAGDPAADRELDHALFALEHRATMRQLFARESVDA